MQSLWMVAASLLFAAMGVCVKLGSAQFLAAELVFYRSAIALLLVALAVGFVGGLGALAQLCMTRAYKHGKTMVSASLAYSTVVFPACSACGCGTRCCL